MTAYLDNVAASRMASELQDSGRVNCRAYSGIT